jgi:DNA-binding protein H-NS
MTLQELLAQRAELDKQIAEVLASEKAIQILVIKDLIATYGITEKELYKKAPKTAKLEPKYRSPTGELWSGRGKTPAWMPLDKAEWVNYLIEHG